jgi:hypothetical protein
MFARTSVALRVRTLSSFGAFLKQNKGLHLGAGRPQRLGKIWRALSTADKAKLAAAGAKIKVHPRVKAPKRPRKLSAYNKFVRANYSKVKRLPHKQRLGAIAKLWKARP